MLNFLIKTTYQEFKAISHFAALKDNLKFVIQPVQELIMKDILLKNQENTINQV